MMTEREIPGFPGYKMRITDDSVDVVSPTGKPRKDNLQGNTVNVVVNLKNISKERLIQFTFPELQPREYIYKIYKDVREKHRESTLTLDVVPGVKLTKLYDPPVYYLETPVWMDLGKVMKTMYPGLQINIIEGNNLRYWREIYFVTDRCTKYVLQQMKDFFEDNPDFLKEPDIYKEND